MSILFGPTRKKEEIPAPKLIEEKKEGAGFFGAVKGGAGRFFNNLFDEPDFIKNAPAPKPPPNNQEIVKTIGETMSDTWKMVRRKPLYESSLDPILAWKISELKDKEKKDKLFRSLTDAGVTIPKLIHPPTYVSGIIPLDQLDENVILKKYAKERAIKDDREETFAREGRWEKKDDSFYEQQIPRKIEDIKKEVIENNKELIETRKKLLEDETKKDILEFYKLQKDEITEEQKNALNEWVAQNIDTEILTDREILESTVPALNKPFQRVLEMPIDIFMEAAKEEFFAGLIESEVEPINQKEEIITTLGHLAGLVGSLALTGGALRGAALLTRTGTAFSKTSPLIFNRAIQAGAFNIHGQLSPELRGNLDARLQAVFFDTSLAILAPFIGEIAPPISRAFKETGIALGGGLFGGLSYLNGDPPEIVLTNALAGGLLHGMGLLNSRQVSNAYKYQARKNLQQLARVKIPKGYTDDMIENFRAKGIALKLAEGEFPKGISAKQQKRIAEKTISEIDSINRSAEQLKKVPKGDRLFFTNPVTNFKLTYNELRKELKGILNLTKKPKLTPAEIDEFIRGTKPGDPKLIQDIIVVGDFKTQLEPPTIEAIKKGDTRRNYESRKQEIEKALGRTKDPKMIKALGKRLDLVLGIGRQLGFEGARVTDIIDPKTDVPKKLQQQNISNITDRLAMYLESLNGLSQGKKDKGISRIRKTIEDLSKQTGISREALAKDILRKGDSIVSQKNVSTQYIKDERVREFLNKELSEISEVGVVGLPEIEPKIKEIKVTPEKEIKNLEKDIQNLYKSKKDSVDEAMSQIFQELEFSRPGERVFLEDNKVIGFDSTFPKWIPKNLRSNKLFDALIKNLLDIENISFPKGNRTKQRELFNEILKEIDNRTDLNSSAQRNQILNLYGKISEAKKTKVTEPARRGAEGRVPITEEKKAEEVKPILPKTKKLIGETQQALDNRINFLGESVRGSKTWQELQEKVFALSKEERGAVFEDLVGLLESKGLKPGGTVGQQIKRFFDNQSKFPELLEQIKPTVIEIPKQFEQELQTIKDRPDFKGKAVSRFTNNNRLVQEDPKTGLKVTSRQFGKNEISLIAQELGIPLPEKILNLPDKKISTKPINKTQEKVREETSKFMEVETRPQDDIEIIPDPTSPNRVSIRFKNYEFNAIKDRGGKLLNPQPDKVINPRVPRDIHRELKQYLVNKYNPNFSTKISGNEVLGFIPKNKTFTGEDKPVFKNSGQFKTPKGKNIIRREKILQELSEKFDVPIRRGKFRKRNAAGIFKETEEIIRIKGKLAQKIWGELGTLKVGTHEIGHKLQKHMPEFSPQNIAKFINELEPIATDGKPLKEGFAEFVSMYVTSPQKLNSRTPQFLTYFEEVMNIRYPQEKSILLNGRHLIDAWNKQEPYVKVMSQISFGEEKRSFKDIMKNIRKSIYNDFVNDLNPLHQVMQQIKKRGGIVDASENPEVLGNVIKGSSSMAHAFIARGTFGKTLFKTTKKVRGFGPFKKTVVDVAEINYKGKGLQEIIDPLIKKYGERVVKYQFNTYLVALRTTELSSRKKPIITGIEKQTAIDALKQLNKNFPEFKKSAEDIITYQKHLLEFALEHGLIGKNDFNAMLEMNKLYVPFFRVMSEGMKNGQMGKLLRGSNPFKRIGGSDRPIVNPIESIAKNTYSIIHTAKKNEMFISMANLSKRFPEFAKVFEEIPTPMARVARIEPKEIFSKKELELIPEEFQDKIVDIFRPSYAAKENVITVRMGDKTKFFQVDPDIYRALISSESMLEVPILWAVLNAPTRMLRAGAILNPDFGVRNFNRDTLMSFVFSKYGFVPFYHTAKGLFRVLKQDKWFQLYEMSGAGYANFVSMDRNYLKKDIRKIIDRKSKLLGLLVPNNPIDLLRSLSELTENAGRVEEFRMSIEHGASAVEAANAAKDLTINFSRSGQYGRSFNMISAFFNARVQGIDKIAREFTGENKAKVTLKAFTAITLPSLILYGINRDDPDYWKLPAWRRDLFWNIKAEWLPGESEWITIPKPFELGLIFGTSFEKMWEFLDKKDRSILTAYFLNFNESSLLAGLLPVDIFNGVPLPSVTAFSPFLENATNIDFFLKRPVVPMGLEGVEPEEQYNFYTTKTARGLGKIFNISPLKIQNVVDGYFAGLGRIAIQTTEGLLTKSGIIKSPLPPEQDLLDNLPGFGALVATTPEGSQSQPVINFFDKLKELEGLNKTYKLKIERNKFLEAEEFLQKNPEMELAKHFRSIALEMSSLRKTQNEVLNSNLSRKEKKELIDQMNRTITILASDSMQYVDPPQK